MADQDIVCPPIPATTAGLDQGGSVYVGGRLAAGAKLALNPGALEVRLSCAATSKWSAAPIREGTDAGFDPTVSWPNGKFQVTAVGESWTDPYAGLDLQWYGEP
jgi:hypothetical protein